MQLIAKWTSETPCTKNEEFIKIMHNTTDIIILVDTSVDIIFIKYDEQLLKGENFTRVRKAFSDDIRKYLPTPILNEKI